ncbi:MAG TPA: hypothetical protein VK172_12775 [Lentimicrobium sp.]|nr:hypothetical protein [Lentimicrobium sp.]
MTKFEALVNLVHSMSLAEKKAFKSKLPKRKNTPEYIQLFDIIDEGTGQTPAGIRKIYDSRGKSQAIETTIKYLMGVLLDSLLDLRKEQDSFYTLLNKILKARVLFEKALFDECFEMLANVKQQAARYENYYALLMAGRIELEYLLILNFPQTDEKELLKKQFQLNESLKYLRKINEQSSLYEILKHRIATKGYARSQKEKDELNDLVYSELSIVASFGPENFEISKLHQLFQSNYLISGGDYNSALRSYTELNNLFEQNKHLWSTPPVYYVQSLEGILESLRSIHNYESMGYFTGQLRKIESNSIDFDLNVSSIIYLYELFPLLDTGQYEAAARLMEENKAGIYSKFHSFSMARQAEICLYTSLIFFGNKQYQKAHKFLSQIIIRGKNYYYLPLYRTIRLVNLLILYKLGDLELIGYEIRSIKRDLSGAVKGYKIEKILLKFLLKELPSNTARRDLLWKRYHTEFKALENDVYEQQVLHIFNFTAWVESVITQRGLGEVLKV